MWQDLTGFNIIMLVTNEFQREVAEKKLVVLYQYVQHALYGQCGEHTPQCQLACQSLPRGVHWECPSHEQQPI